MKLQNLKKMQVYNFYPSILDTFYNYINCSKTYQKFWGNSEAPSKTEEEYEQECFKQLIDKINRVIGLLYREGMEFDLGCRKH